MSDAQPDQRLILTRNLMDMLSDWGLSMEHIKAVLGLSTPSRKMDRFRSEVAFPDEPEVNTRIEHIVGIAEGLSTAYPQNSKMAKVWLQRPHRKFAKRAPLEVMVVDGMNGLIYVRAEIDCTFAYDATNS